MLGLSSFLEKALPPMGTSAAAKNPGFAPGLVTVVLLLSNSYMFSYSLSINY